MKRPAALLYSLRLRVKDCFMTAESPPLRWAFDRLLRRRASDRISLNDPARVHAEILAPLQSELTTVLGFSSEFEAEMYVRRFEADFARRCGRRFAAGTHSGTSALQLALVALGIGPGDEVITVPYTYIATALAISNTGAKPVFVDIDPTTFNLDPTRIESAITPRTKAIVPVHLYGKLADMEAITRIAAAHGLKVVEDACQAFGAERGGGQAGALGDIGCFSFSTPKLLGGLGNGGMVVTDSREVIEKVRALRNPETNDPALLVGRRTPCYLDAIQIAFLRAKLPHVNAWIERRRRQADRYRSALGSIAVQLPTEEAAARHTYYRFAVRTRQRDELGRWLNRLGIRAVHGYSPSVHLTRTFGGLACGPGSFPHAETASRETLLLPISHVLTDEETDRVARGVRSFFPSRDDQNPHP